MKHFKLLCLIISLILLVCSFTSCHQTPAEDLELPGEDCVMVYTITRNPSNNIGNSKILLSKTWRWIKTITPPIMLTRNNLGLLDLLALLHNLSNLTRQGNIVDKLHLRIHQNEVIDEDISNPEMCTQNWKGVSRESKFHSEKEERKGTSLWRQNLKWQTCENEVRTTNMKSNAQVMKSEGQQSKTKFHYDESKNKTDL